MSLRAGCALVLLAALLLALTQQLIDRTLPVTLPLVLSLMFFASLRYEVQHEASSYARRRAVNMRATRCGFTCWCCR